MEIELQYLFSGGGTIVVPAELAGFALAESLSFDIVDDYYDSADFDLRRNGCSLRVRRQSNMPHPLLTWKGPSERREDGAKQREEVETPIDHVPADGAEIASILARYKLWELITPPTGILEGVELSMIGELKNRRSSHLYVQGLHRLELTWDRLTYPLGEAEVRMEVEAKRQAAARFLPAVDAELRRMFNGNLAPAPHGKTRELCVRLYPDIFAPKPA